MRSVKYSVAVSTAGLLITKIGGALSPARNLATYRDTMLGLLQPSGSTRRIETRTVFLSAIPTGALDDFAVNCGTPVLVEKFGRYGTMGPVRPPAKCLV